MRVSENKQKMEEHWWSDFDTFPYKVIWQTWTWEEITSRKGNEHFKLGFRTDLLVQPLKVKLPISCKTLVDEQDGIKVTDGENDFEQNGVLELRLIRNQEQNNRYDKGWFLNP